VIFHLNAYQLPERHPHWRCEAESGVRWQSHVAGSGEIGIIQLVHLNMTQCDQSSSGQPAIAEGSLVSLYQTRQIGIAGFAKRFRVSWFLRHKFLPRKTALTRHEDRKVLCEARGHSTDEAGQLDLSRPDTRHLSFFGLSLYRSASV
jgi:hypothetical protein